ncbi:hypothetical protein F2P81_022571 [Scophthalmus maximus]|uniref:Uncharacterized protein n=1 Tax=Scophthalmus maximus TaxID=52904 RepID=A0A6A4S207_SCOMX|nr:hypothetical protein F2P81_022571 [Scophthalmus maximus]
MRMLSGTAVRVDNTPNEMQCKCDFTQTPLKRPLSVSSLPQPKSERLNTTTDKPFFYCTLFAVRKYYTEKSGADFVVREHLTDAS